MTFFDKRKSPYLFLLPFFLMFCIFWIWPIIQSFLWSFYNWDGLREPVFRGLKNYIALFSEVDYQAALKNTLMAAFVYIAVMLLCALTLGFLLNSDLLPGKPAFRTLFFLPVTVSLPVVALIFYIIYAKNNGVLNSILINMGMKNAVDWLGDPRVNLWAIVALRIWRASGYYAVFIIAGLQGIPGELLEAGVIDGAGRRQLFFKIILPLLRPVILYIIVASSIWAFQLFEEPWILTRGGPMNSTSTIAMHVYRNGFQFFRLGYASTSAYVLTMIIVLFTGSQIILSKRGQL